MTVGARENVWNVLCFGGRCAPRAPVAHTEGMQDAPDPRFFISTARQREEAAAVQESEPQLVAPRVYLGSRDCVLHKRAHLRQLGIECIVHCCDRAPDDPKTFEYRVVACNNETRDAGDQHSRHVHDDDGDCCGDDAGSCRDLHLLKWVDADAGTCLADDVVAWIASRVAAGKSVLIVGFDGVTNSCAIAVAYVMRALGLRLRDALDCVQRARPIVRLTPALRRDLEMYGVRIAAATLTTRIVPRRATAADQ